LQNTRKIVEHDVGEVLISPEGGIIRESRDEDAGFNENGGRRCHVGGEEGVGGADGQVTDAGNNGADGLEHNCFILRRGGNELRNAGVGDGNGVEIPRPKETLLELGDLWVRCCGNEFVVVEDEEMRMSSECVGEGGSMFDEVVGATEGA